MRGIACAGAVLAFLGCRGGPCEEEPHVALPFPECDAEDGVFIEDEADFVARCGSEPVDESFEPIDLSRQVVLGLSGQGTGCTVEFEEAVCRDDRAEVLTHELTVKSRGTCDKTVARNSWLAIDIPPAGWSIEFDVVGR